MNTTTDAPYNTRIKRPIHTFACKYISFYIHTHKDTLKLICVFAVHEAQIRAVRDGEVDPNNKKVSIGLYSANANVNVLNLYVYVCVRMGPRQRGLFC